ncbi:serine protease [Pseudonocardia abyssalis]|uniref:serine protease n=1 Tax=Pseudonocardia abyssalis TaxID=2792008 RepID=UPI001CED47E3|nr:serine protease [Pseudonocardia abyssalis]
MRVSNRSLASLGAVTGVVAVAVFIAPAATAAPPLVAAPAATSVAADWAPADSAAIRPGVVTESAGGGACTSNFVFTSGDRTFIGQAAHCAGTGEATETNGCDSGTGPLGTAVTILAADGTERAGTLAYSSWVTMQENGEADPDTCQFNDFALVEIAPEDVVDVNPSIPFFGGPVGLDTDGLPAGEQVFSYGNSPLRLGIEQLSPKVGVSAGDTGGGFSHEVYTVTPGVPGDSGSAFLDGDGDAVGILSTLNLAPLPVSNGVADLALALAYANEFGGVGDIALVPGTEAFSALPAGVPLTAVSPPAGPPVNG